MNFYRIVDSQVPTKCVNIKGTNITSLEAHQNVILYTSTGSNEQKWAIKSVCPTLSTEVLSAVDTSFGFNVNRRQGNDYYNCDVLQVAGNAKDSAVVLIPDVNPGFYRIKLANYDYYLTALGTYNATNIKWSLYGTGENQVWQLVPLGIKGCDTASGVYKFGGDVNKIPVLTNNDIAFVARYLNEKSGYRDGLTLSEAKAISNAGMYLVSLYQEGSAGNKTIFTAEKGIADASAAVSLAANLGQPNSTPIYFCVDCEAYAQDYVTYISRYVNAINSWLTTSGNNPKNYKLGIYGSPAVCSCAKNAYPNCFTMLANAWAYTGTFTDWDIKQSLPTTLSHNGSTLNVDPDVSADRYFGQWQIFN